LGGPIEEVLPEGQDEVGVARQGFVVNNGFAEELLPWRFGKKTGLVREESFCDLVQVS